MWIKVIVKFKFLRTHGEPMDPKVATTLTNARATARLDDESGIELLTHAKQMMNAMYD